MARKGSKEECYIIIIIIHTCIWNNVYNKNCKSNMSYLFRKLVFILLVNYLSSRDSSRLCSFCKGLKIYVCKIFYRYFYNLNHNKIHSSIANFILYCLIRSEIKKNIDDCQYKMIFYLWYFSLPKCLQYNLTT